MYNNLYKPYYLIPQNTLTLGISKTVWKGLWETIFNNLNDHPPRFIYLTIKVELLGAIIKCTINILSEIKLLGICDTRSPCMSLICTCKFAVSITKNLHGYGKR